MDKSGEAASTSRIVRLVGALSPATSIAWLVHRFFSRLFKFREIPSFSQFGEDRLLDFYVGNKEVGFFVDVGCNHPIRYSNTFRLYLRGWRGLAIDADSEILCEYRRVRPKDTTICAVISDHGGRSEFFKHSNSLISGVGEQLSGPWRRTRANCEVIEVGNRTLTDVLLNEGGGALPDLLLIDVEGHEANVLRSLDFSRFSPRLILVEIHDFQLGKETDYEVCSILLEHGYKIAATFAVNVLFIKPAS